MQSRASRGLSRDRVATGGGRRRGERRFASWVASYSSLALYTSLALPIWAYTACLWNNFWLYNFWHLIYVCMCVCVCAYYNSLSSTDRDTEMIFNMRHANRLIKQRQRQRLSLLCVVSFNVREWVCRILVTPLGWPFSTHSQLHARPMQFVHSV